MTKFWAVLLFFTISFVALSGPVFSGGSAKTTIQRQESNSGSFEKSVIETERQSTSEANELEKVNNKITASNISLCYFGLKTCADLETTQKAGLFLPWYELLSIAAIIFVVFEFAERSKTRLFLFHLSILKPWMLLTIVLSIISIAFANLLPLIPGRTIPLFSYPSTYEVLSLLGISGLFLGFCVFLFKPYWFRPRFSYSLLVSITRLLRNRNDKESISALILLTSSYLERIIAEAKKYDYFGRRFSIENTPEPEKLTLLSRDFIDVILSRDKICSVIAKEHSYFIEQYRIFYLEKLNFIRYELERMAKDFLEDKFNVNISLNTQDFSLLGESKGRSGYYFSAIGSALDYGEEGVVGRGNRARGVRSCLRPNSTDAIHGKNPSFHVGKVYTYFGDQISKAIAEEMGCECVVILATQNKRPTNSPQKIIINISKKRNEKEIKEIVERELSKRDWVEKIVEDKYFLPSPGRYYGQKD